MGEKDSRPDPLFRTLDDPDAALKKYLEEKDDLHAGRPPRRDQDAITMRDFPMPS
jgi:hypothetical protein